MRHSGGRALADYLPGRAGGRPVPHRDRHGLRGLGRPFLHARRHGAPRRRGRRVRHRGPEQRGRAGPKTRWRTSRSWACTSCVPAGGGIWPPIRWGKPRTPYTWAITKTITPATARGCILPSTCGARWGFPSAWCPAPTAARPCAGGTPRKTARCFKTCWTCSGISGPRRCFGTRARRRAMKTARRAICSASGRWCAIPGKRWASRSCPS